MSNIQISIFSVLRSLQEAWNTHIKNIMWEMKYVGHWGMAVGVWK